MINNFIPFVAVGYFLLFFRAKNLNLFLTGLMFVSFYVFSSNYSTLGFDFDFYRYLHRFIGILSILALIFHIFKYKIFFIHESVVKIMALFLLLIMLSFIGENLNLNNYAHYLRNFVFISAIVLFLFYSLDNNEKINQVFKLIVALSLLLTGFVFFELIQNGWGNRIRLVHLNANYLAFALFIGFTLCIFHSKSKLKWLCCFLILFAIFGTGSRSVEAASLCVTLFFVYQNLEKKIYFIPFILVIISILALFFNQIFLNQSNVSSRIVINQIAFESFKENPINGVGYGQFRSKFHKFINADILEKNNHEINEAFLANYPESYLWDSPKYRNLSPNDKNFIKNNSEKEKMTHNDFFTILSELGSFGLVFLIYAFYKLYLELKKLNLYNTKFFDTSLSLIFGTLFFSFFHNNLTSFVFWFVLFIPFIINRNYEKTK